MGDRSQESRALLLGDVLERLGQGRAATVRRRCAVPKAPLPPPFERQKCIEVGKWKLRGEGRGRRREHVGQERMGHIRSRARAGCAASNGLAA